MDKLVRAVDQTFTELGINRLNDWKAVGGRAGVGLPTSDIIEPMWNDQQIGIIDGTAPRTLRDGQKRVVDHNAVNAARETFTTLLGPIGGSMDGTRIIGSAWVNTMASLAMPARAGGQLPAHQPVPIAASA
jgi:5-aminolevulinate synthase